MSQATRAIWTTHIEDLLMDNFGGVLVLGLIISPIVLPGFIAALVITLTLGKIVRQRCSSLCLEYNARVSSQARSRLRISEIFMTSFTTILMWYFSWSIFSSYLDRDLSRSAPQTLSGMEGWSAAFGVYIHAFAVYGFVLGLIPGLTAIICFYVVRKIAVAKVKSA
jgi:hypothetical protein